MLPFIISGIVGSLIPTLYALYDYVLYASTFEGHPFEDNWILILLGAILAGSVSGYLGLKLYERRGFPFLSAKGVFIFLSAIIGFFLSIVLAIVYFYIYAMGAVGAW